MSDLVNRLRGQYSQDSHGKYVIRIEDWVPEISMEAAEEIEKLQHLIQLFANDLNSPSGRFKKKDCH